MPPANFTPEMGSYKTLQPFRYWCQKILPLVYDDSLSYYELLCKVVDYLNKTMEDVETLHGDTTKLHMAYDELQNYVNTYFSSLDVQQEINNKLDEMAENGELAVIFSKYFGLYYTPEMFGAVGNGANDDSLAFNTCYKKCVADKLPMWLKGSSNYVLTSLTMEEKPITIIGNGATITTKSNNVVFWFGFHSSIDNVIFDGNNGEYAAQFKGEESVISNCWFVHAKTLLNLISGGYALFFKNCNFGENISYCSLGLNLNITDCHFTDCQWINCDLCVNVNAGEPYFTSCHFWSNKKDINEKPLGTSVFNQNYQITAVNCFFDTINRLCTINKGLRNISFSNCVCTMADGIETDNTIFFFNDSTNNDRRLRLNQVTFYAENKIRFSNVSWYALFKNYVNCRIPTTLTDLKNVALTAVQNPDPNKFSYSNLIFKQCENYLLITGVINVIGDVTGGIIMKVNTNARGGWTFNHPINGITCVFSDTTTETNNFYINDEGNISHNTAKKVSKYIVNLMLPSTLKYIELTNI